MRTMTANRLTFNLARLSIILNVIGLTIVIIIGFMRGFDAEVGKGALNFFSHGLLWWLILTQAKELGRF